jgi:magnesium transporter
VQLREGGLHSEQVAVVFGKDWLLSFQETRGDVFDPVRARLRLGRPRLRQGGADYLAYSLLDALVDGFFPLIDQYEERLELLEDEVFRNPGPLIVEVTHLVRRDLLLLRRWLWPLREAIAAMQRTEGSLLVKKDTRLFLRDAYDHTVRVMEVVESYRELAGSIAELQTSMQARRLNEIIKVLTVMTAIFIPVTFVANIYGMNFDNMPELGWRYGYFAVLVTITAVIMAELIFFRKRGWI